MGRRDRVGDDARGGEDIPPSRSAGAALIAGAAATATSAGLATWLAVGAENDASSKAAGAIGALATATLAVGLLVRLPAAVGACAVLLGSAYTIVLAVDGGQIDRAAPLVGALLLLVCELGYWSHELRTTSPDEPGARARHVAWLCLLVLGALAAGVVLEVTAELARVDGIAMDVFGAAAAIAAFAVLTYLATSAGLAPRRVRGAHTEGERPEEAPWRGA